MAINNATPTKTGDPVYDTFVMRSLGTLLPQCIQQLTEKHPADPIEFISQSLYKAVDSRIYKEEKDKYLRDCLEIESQMKSEREERRARLDMLLEEERAKKEELRKAREDEIAALTHLAQNAALYGIELSPRTLKRLSKLQEEERQAEAADKPIEMKMPRVKRLPDGTLQVIRDESRKGTWEEVEEIVTTASGREISVKTRKWVPGEGDEKPKGRRSIVSSDEPKRKKAQGAARDLGSSLYDGSQDMGGSIAITNRGVFTYTSDPMGTLIPPDPLERTLAPADNPDIWARDKFDCHTLYDHELYIRCDADGWIRDEKDINQHASPRMLVREYLESVSRQSTSEESDKSTERRSAEEIMMEQKTSIEVARRLSAFIQSSRDSE